MKKKAKRKIIWHRVIIALVLVYLTASSWVLAYLAYQDKVSQEKTIETVLLLWGEVEEQEEWTEIVLCSNSSIKTYMDGSKITDKTSQAYAVISELYVNENGLYTDGEYIAVALSNYYGCVGDKFRITLDTGKVIYAIMADTKKSSELHNYCTHSDGSMVEMIIDTEKAKESYRMGVLMGNFNYEEEFSGDVVKIERLKV